MSLFDACVAKKTSELARTLTNTLYEPPPTQTSKHVHIGLPLPPDIADNLISDGMDFVVNGMHYKVKLEPGTCRR